MPELVPALNKDDIEKTVAAVAEKISADYKDRKVILIGVLNGAFMFLADLARRLTIPIKIDFVGIASYGSDTCSSGNIQVTKKIGLDIRDKNLLIIEDIIDTGLTMAFLIDYLKSFSPKTIKICALLDKLERRQTKIKADYTGRVVQKGFFVGYGLDYAGNYRNLPEIYHLKF